MKDLLEKAQLGHLHSSNGIKQTKTDKCNVQSNTFSFAATKCVLQNKYNNNTDLNALMN